MPLKFYSEKDTDPGEWRDWCEPQPGEKIRAKVRRILPVQQKQILYRHLGKTRRMTLRKGETGTEWNPEKQERVNRDIATFCLVETEGFELEVPGEGGAALVGGLLNEEVKSGDVVKLDGRWTDALKSAVFDMFPDFLEWVVETAESMLKSDRQEDAEALGN